MGRPRLAARWFLHALPRRLADGVLALQQGVEMRCPHVGGHLLDGLSRLGIAASGPCRIAGGGMQTLPHRRGCLPLRRSKARTWQRRLRRGVKRKKKECYCHVAAMLFILLPCYDCCYVIAMLLPCVCLVFAMLSLLPSFCHILLLPCGCHAIATSLPWHCEAVAMLLQCYCHASAMSLPCYCHGVARLLPR